jgi:hypothetical protein
MGRPREAVTSGARPIPRGGTDVKILRPLVVLAIAIGLAACGNGGNSKVQPVTQPITSAPGSFPDEAIPTTTQPKVAVPKLHVGDTANLVVVNESVGSVGAEAPRFAVDPSKPTIGRIQVARVKTTRGGEFDTPERGLYLGVYVKAQSTTGTGVPGGLSWNLYAVVNHHHYDTTFAADGFKPEFSDVYLHPGETNEGWFVFDVPAAHGTVVMTDQMSDEQVATWSF